MRHEALCRSEAQFHGEGSWEDRPEPIVLRLIDTETNEVVWQTEIDSNRPTYIVE